MFYHLGMMPDETDDCKSFLETELETLQSIYINEINVESKEKPQPTVVSIDLHPATADNVDEQYVRMTLIFTLSGEYPEVVPQIVMRNTRGLSEEKLNRISQDLDVIANDKKGNSMLFEIIEAAKEHLTAGNRPSEECAICQYDFSDRDVFTKTECYHYFHSHCLARYAAHALHCANETQSEELNKKFPCPMCRIPIEFQGLIEEFPPPSAAEEDTLEISEEIITLQKMMADLYRKQIEKGGIIDVEAERNKYLLEISNVQPIASDDNKPSTSDSMSCNVESEINSDNLESSMNPGTINEKSHEEHADKNYKRYSNRFRNGNRNPRYDKRPNRLNFQGDYHQFRHHETQRFQRYPKNRSRSTKFDNDNGDKNEKCEVADDYKVDEKPSFSHNRREINKDTNNQGSPYHNKKYNDHRYSGSSNYRGRQPYYPNQHSFRERKQQHHPENYSVEKDENFRPPMRHTPSSYKQDNQSKESIENPSEEIPSKSQDSFEPNQPTRKHKNFDGHQYQRRGYFPHYSDTRAMNSYDSPSRGRNQKFIEKEANHEENNSNSAENNSQRRNGWKNRNEGYYSQGNKDSKYHKSQRNTRDFHNDFHSREDSKDYSGKSRHPPSHSAKLSQGNNDSVKSVPEVCQVEATAGAGNLIPESNNIPFAKTMLPPPPGFANPLKKVIYGLQAANPPPGFHR